MFRRVFSSATAVVAAVAIAVSAAAAAPIVLADLTGAWNLNLEIPNQPMSSVLNIVQKGDSISGSNTSDMGTIDFRGIVKGDSVYFGFNFDMGGQQITIIASGLVKDEQTMEGLYDISGFGAFPFKAVRQK